MGRLFEAICSGVDMNHRRFWKVIEYAKETYKPGMTALEVGCDDGAFALGLTMVGYQVTSLDPIRTPFLAHLYNHQAMSLKRYKVLFDLWEAPDFDLVHLGEVLEHVKDPDAMLDRACSVCSGKIIVSVPNFTAVGHVRTYTSIEFKELLEPYMTIEWFHPIESHKKPGKFQWLAMGSPKAGDEKGEA